MWRVVLDERGNEISSRDLAKKIEAWEQRGPRDFALLIGGADGHSEPLRKAADWTWSLSKLTLQHELALVVTLEQLYRAYTIKAGLPYHRDCHGGDPNAFSGSIHLLIARVVATSVPLMQNKVVQLVNRNLRPWVKYRYECGLSQLFQASP